MWPSRRKVALAAKCLAADRAAKHIGRARRTKTAKARSATRGCPTDVRGLPREHYKSLTWDRGKELADHKRFTMTTDIDVYFYDPQGPWQRGSNENTNRSLRPYLSKGTDLSVHSQTHLNSIARQLNERPRMTLQFETPVERFNACVAATS